MTATTPLSESPYWDPKTRTYDWDAERAQYRRDNPPPVLHTFGEDVELPYSTPVKVYVARQGRDENAELSLEILLEELQPLVGDRVHAWIDEHDLGVGDLVQLLSQCNRVMTIAAQERRAKAKKAKKRGKKRGKPKAAEADS